jgi:hypothetical protein
MVNQVGNLSMLVLDFERDDQDQEEESAICKSNHRMNRHEQNHLVLEHHSQVGESTQRQQTPTNMSGFKANTTKAS